MEMKVNYGCREGSYWDDVREDVIGKRRWQRLGSSDVTEAGGGREGGGGTRETYT